MGLMYIARCKAGKIVAAAVANTPLEQADCAGDVKRWSKKYTVTLEECKKEDYIWCMEEGRNRCKKCEHLREAAKTYAGIVNSSEQKDIYEDSTNDVITINIEQEFWKSIRQAAEESTWIPKEYYYMNDWVADVCDFLRNRK